MFSEKEFWVAVLIILGIGIAIGSTATYVMIKIIPHIHISIG